MNMFARYCLSSLLLAAMLARAACGQWGATDGGRVGCLDGNCGSSAPAMGATAAPPMAYPQSQPRGATQTRASYPQQLPQTICRIRIDERNSLIGYGSGVLIDPEHILTCEHLFDGAIASIQARFAYGPDELVRCELVAIDKLQDLALLKVPKQDRPFCRIAPRAPQKGDEVVLCGWGGEGKYRELFTRCLGYEQMGEVALMKVAGNPRQGDSGGPVLFNGCVCSINSFGSPASGGLAAESNCPTLSGIQCFLAQAMAPEQDHACDGPIGAVLDQPGATLALPDGTTVPVGDPIKHDELVQRIIEDVRRELGSQATEPADAYSGDMTPPTREPAPEPLSPSPELLQTQAELARIQAEIDRLRTERSFDNPEQPFGIAEPKIDDDFWRSLAQSPILPPPASTSSDATRDPIGAGAAPSILEPDIEPASSGEPLLPTESPPARAAQEEPESSLLGDALDKGGDIAIEQGSKWLPFLLGMTGPSGILAGIGIRILLKRAKQRREASRRVTEVSGSDDFLDERAKGAESEWGERDVTEAVQLIQLGEYSGRSSILDALAGQLIEPVLRATESEGGDSAKAIVKQIRTRLMTELNRVAPLAAGQS